MPPYKNEKCNACGGFEFSLSDGFKYCDRCGSLLENFEELVEDEDAMQVVGAAKIKTKKTRAEGENKRQKRVEPLNLPKWKITEEALQNRADFFKNQIARNEELPIPHDASPDYLFRLALRIFSFTQILSKTGYILVKEMNFDQKLPKIILATFQKYLAHCQVAFCHSEQCGSDEQLRFVALMENVQFEEEERAEKRRKKLERRGKGVKALSQSAAAWTLLTQGNITEHLDIDSDDSDEDQTVQNPEIPGVSSPKTPKTPKIINKSMRNLSLEPEDLTQGSEFEGDVNVNDTTVGFVRKVTTALSKEALRRAAQMILNLESLVAILHSSLATAGYTNLMVSDIVRWIREDRFRISRRSLYLSSRGLVDRGDTEQVLWFNVEQNLRYPLYEIVRTCTIFHQSLKLSDTMAPQSFEKLSARLINNLNLPVDILSRLLLLESMIPCDLSPLLEKQANVSMGFDMKQLSAVTPKLKFQCFMSSFGRKEQQTTEADKADEVLLSIETRLTAYLLLALKLTFDLDSAPCSDDDVTSEKFDLDTWIHQLEMRIRCWQGDDMTKVLRSTCPIPENYVEQPFGNDTVTFTKDGAPYIKCSRRQIGFRKCIPQEMSFNSTSQLPTVFDIRTNRFKAERTQVEAILAPLKFQKTILKKEMEWENEKYANIDPRAEKTFFKDFTTSKTVESAGSFDEFFPFSTRYSPYPRPDWLQNCSARQKALGESQGPLRFYLSTKGCDDLFGVASLSFSPKFRFLLKSLSLIIGEDEKAVYAAFVMLEMHLTASERLHNIRQALLDSEPIPIECQVYSKSTFHKTKKYGIISTDPVDKIEKLKYFNLTDMYFEEGDISTHEDVMHIKDARHQTVRDSISRENAQREQNTVRKLSYDFEQLFSILAVKCW